MIAFSLSHASGTIWDYS